MHSTLPQVSQLKHHVEGALAHKFAGALSPRIRLEREFSATGIEALDDLLKGGLSVGSLSELVGTVSSGRTTVALSLLSVVTARETAAAWIDVSDTFDPQSAALCGVDLRRLLWVRCADAVPPSAVAVGSRPHMQEGMREAVQAVPRGGGSPHPRAEAQGMSEAVASLLQTQPRSAAIKDRNARPMIGTPGAPNRPLMPFPAASPYRGEQVPTDRMPSRRRIAETKAAVTAPNGILPRMRRAAATPAACPKNNWTAMDRALRVADLLLQSAGFTLVVLDLGSLPAEVVSRIPISTWFRFRAACERTRTTLVLLTQFACAKSSADAVVRLKQADTKREENVFTGMWFAAEVERERTHASAQSNVIPMRKPPRSERDGQWSSRTTWAVR